MPIFEKPPLETLPPVRDRWTPLYLEHGRLEVDDASVKWIGADRQVMRLPVASLSALMLGPGTTVTHAAVNVCALADTPICWIGDQGMRFYAVGAATSHDNERARVQAKLASNVKTHEAVARKMFLMRFSDIDVSKYSVNELRGFEGRRVRKLYEQMGERFGVSWKGRNYDVKNWSVGDNINRAISVANSALYALTTSVVVSMGYLPQLGFIHTGTALPFVYDIADVYKPVTTLPAAFEMMKLKGDPAPEDVLTRLKYYIEKEKILSRMPGDIQTLMTIEKDGKQG